MTWVVIDRCTGRYLERVYPSGFVLWTLDDARAQRFDDQRHADAMARYRIPTAADVVKA